jgi:ubiquinone/menaquinone biosynthesis C-methylase UbiE
MKISPYPKLVAERYDITRKAPFPGELEYYLACLNNPGGEVLELGCGSGRLLVPMAKRGINITGTDASPHMLAACERRCADEGIHPNLHLQTMQQLNIDRQFAMIFIADGTFGLLVEDADVELMLEGAYRHLEPGGVLAFDFGTPAIQLEDDHTEPRPWSNWVEAEDGTVILSRATPAVYDRNLGLWREFRIDEKWVDGKLIESEGWVSSGRDCSAEVVEAFCVNAGFEQVRVTSHWAGPVVDNSQQLQGPSWNALSLTCRKPSL